MITEEFYQTYGNFAKEHENVKLKIYDDGFGVPTIGAGFALINKVKEGWEAYNIDYLKTIGINLSNKQYEIICH
ncbi:hypothetical protein NOVO_03195 [Rickettsiales bacterium Ac37b]|nr:hypothetical protein NOVO_03195 [Rickettsiales bacterium Ac37b]